MGLHAWLLAVLCGTLVTASIIVSVPERQFLVDYENDQFLLDGQPFRFVSGSLHYFRLPREYWQDRLHKFKAAGLNAVATYVEWSQHEPSPGVYDFSGDLDIEYFLQLAAQENLVVLLRPGPYICAERDMGGFPSWLLTLNPNMRLRTYDDSYRERVQIWLNVLMPKIQPYLYGNGGPIIMVQVENEYGSYPACDFSYTSWLRDTFNSYVGTNAVLFTTDGNADSFLQCGKIDGVYATVDFGPGSNVNASFQAMRNHQAHGPFVNSEFYPGWLTHWGENLQTVNTTQVVNTLEEMLMLNASVNFYMFYGGTNFGFTSGADWQPGINKRCDFCQKHFLNGANFGNKYQPQITSYDYNAPLTEAGDPTEKYFAIRDIIRKYLPIPDVAPPVTAPKGSYGTVTLSNIGFLLDDEILNAIGSLPITSTSPLTFEDIGQRYGFVLYETTAPPGISDPALLQVFGVKDRALVFVNNKLVTALSFMDQIYSTPLLVNPEDKISLLVENQGRINYGSRINDFKGITSNVTLSGQVLTGWTITGLPMTNISNLNNMQGRLKDSLGSGPAFFKAEFQLPGDTVPLDTFLNVQGWGKGIAFINGRNLGRYWPQRGPQVTLYVPGVYLKSPPEVNSIVLFELQSTPVTLQVEFVPNPIYISQRKSA